MDNAGSYTRTYNNNWLSQFGLYKYQTPERPLKKPNTQHHRIGIYGIFGMLFILFFFVFIIITESTIEGRKIIIQSYSNETSIESSMDQDILTTPMQNEVSATVKRISFKNVPPPPRRMKRLDSEEIRNASKNLVFLPSRLLRPPKSGTRRQSNSRQLYTSNDNTENLFKPRPFNFQMKGIPPSAFKKQNDTNFHELSFAQIPKNYQGRVNSIQDILKQMHGSKTYNQFPQQINQQQPSEFGNPMYRNHRIKFSGVYRRPRQNGGFNNPFDASSRQNHFSALKPHYINQLAAPTQYMPDPLYNFKPQSPSDINLLAVKQFRFAPQADSFENIYQKVIETNNKRQQGDDTERNMKGKSKPFSLMLDIYPMQDEDTPSNSQNYNNRPNKYRKPIFNQDTSSYFNNYNYPQIQQQKFQPQHQNDYYNNNYFRSSIAYNQQNQTMEEGVNNKPSQMLVHLNLYPKNKKQQQNQFQNNFQRHDLNEGEQHIVPFVLNEHARSSEILLTTKSPATHSSNFEIVKSIEIPTNINFDNVTIGDELKHHQFEPRSDNIPISPHIANYHPNNSKKTFNFAIPATDFMKFHINDALT